MLKTFTNAFLTTLDFMVMLTGGIGGLLVIPFCFIITVALLSSIGLLIEWSIKELKDKYND